MVARKGSLAAAVLAGQEALRSVMTINGLRDAAAAVKEAADRAGCRVLVPASRSADGLVGATLLMADGALATLDQRDSDHDVPILVIESVAVTRANLNEKVNELSNRGYTNVHSYAYRDFSDQLDLNVEPYGASASR